MVKPEFYLGARLLVPPFDTEWACRVREDTSRDIREMVRKGILRELAGAVGLALLVSHYPRMAGPAGQMLRALGRKPSKRAARELFESIEDLTRVHVLLPSGLRLQVFNAILLDDPNAAHSDTEVEVMYSRTFEALLLGPRTAEEREADGQHKHRPAQPGDV